MTNLANTACRFLESLHRFDLAMLMRHCEVSLEEKKVDNGFFFDLVEVVIIMAPSPIAEALSKLSPYDRKRIAEAVVSGHPDKEAPDELSVSTTEAAIGGSVALLAELLIHREMMIDVATGGTRIQDVDDYYRAREARIRRANPGDIKYENPHPDLWDWYRHWNNELPQYRDRRFYVRQMFSPAIDLVSSRSLLLSEPREETGWERVDRALAKARDQLENASAEEDCQAIGLLCREVIISLAQAVFDPELHEPIDGVRPSATDANRMLEGYVAHVFPGASYKEVRAHARAALALALNLQHRRTATRQLAALCVEATASTAAIFSIIARVDEK